MNRWQIIRRSLTHHWRIHLAVALGVAAATAVLTGALLVGDSVRGSLRSLTLDRLGRIDEVLVSDRFFSIETVERMRANSEFKQHFDVAETAILFPQATVESQGSGASARASDVLVIGCEADFWDLDSSGVRPEAMPGPDQVVINQTLADDWGARVGDRVVVRLPEPNQVPADSPLAKKTDRTRSLPQLEIVAIVPARGLGGFRLRPSQSLPRNVFLPIADLHDALDQPGRANAVLVSLKPSIGASSAAAERASQALASAFRPTFEDYGLAIQRVTQSFPTSERANTAATTSNEPPTSELPAGEPPAGEPTSDEPLADHSLAAEPVGDDVVFDYFSVTTDRMILSPAVAEVARVAFAPYDGQPLFTYLANSIQRVAAEEGIPYSTITAIDFTPQFAPRSLSGEVIEPLADDEIVLNSWAAEDQQAQPDDRIEIAFFAPETTHGEAVERRDAFTLKAITPLTVPARPYARGRAAEFDTAPTLVNDPDLTPTVAGVTDQETIDDWDPPFPFDRNAIRRQDDDYWALYRTTPKAFISLAAGQRLWGSRFGDVTAFRIPYRDGLTANDLQNAFLKTLADRGETLGFNFIPVKRRQLQASRGTTPFDLLFLGLSFFIVAAALLLVALLFRLGVEQRAAEVGILLASGFRRRTVARMLSVEGALVAAAGGVLGAGVGLAYAWLMVSGLRTWWVGAITTPFLQFHWTIASVLIGYGLGVLVSVLTIFWSVRQLRKTSVRQLLAGRATDSAADYRKRSWDYVAAGACLVVAVGLLCLATTLGGMPQAGAFVGGGALLLGGLLLLIWGWLKRGGSSGWQTALAGSHALFRLAMRSAARNPGRSGMTIGLMATASFLIVAMSSFRLAPTEAGTGGFELLAESAQPIFVDLNSGQVQRELLGDQAHWLASGRVFGLRLKSGDDASCNNLYQATQPRVIGVTPAFIAHFDDPATPSFAWAGHAAATDAQRANPWRLLDSDAGAAALADDGQASGASRDDAASSSPPAIPVVIDMATALYSLKPPLTVGSEYVATYDNGSPIRFRVVGLLENSVLQGSLMIAEDAFERSFPDVSGYRFFLIESPPGDAEQVAAALEDRLSDQGFDTVPARRVLSQLLAVQNTYLSTFQSLGALGLLLGTFGLATVQLRNVVERRGELALLRAAGFRRSLLGRLVLLENLVLLGAGLATGVLAAAIAVLPHKLLGDASIPVGLLLDLSVMLLVVLVVGIATGLAAVRAALRTPVLQALRGD